MDDAEALSVATAAAAEKAEEGEHRADDSNNNNNKKDNDGGDGDGGADRCEEVVRWERFLPRMVVRVLVVEADHATRQIITSILRKCSYSVIAVSNGLKAWEILKKKATDLDLILTEVELPAISGFALLTLIMEHEICRNIPVIMMSSDDSINMVLKCMLKGATDFLIKPVRRNELKNLWRHVWSKHFISRLPQNTISPQKKLKIASEDNSATDQSSGSVASSLKNNGCIEKLSEAQDPSELRSSLKLSNNDAVQHEESATLESESSKHNDETGERSVALISEAASCKETLKSTYLRIEQDHCCAKTESQDDILRAELSRANSNINTENRVGNDVVVEPSRGAINLIAAFENLEKPISEDCSLIGDVTTNFDFGSKLELSLRSDLTGNSCKQANEASEERQRINHSDTSAFSWYNGSSKLLQPLFPTQSITSAKLNNTDWNSRESHKSSGNVLGTSCQYGGTIKNQENMTTLVLGQYRQFGPKLSSSGPFPVTEVTSDIKSKGHGNAFTSVIYAQSGVHSMWSPKPVCQKESSPFPSSTSSRSNPESHNSEQHYHWSDDGTYTSFNQNVHDKSNLEHARHDSSAVGPGDSLCNDAANHINSNANESVGSGSDGNATSSTVVAKNNPENFSDNGYHNYDGFRGTNSHRSSQREAALTKFRLKRKERCYQKKVRYQSRKRLAEQRPRVKGQFVRQVQHDHPVADASAIGGRD